MTGLRHRQGRNGAQGFRFGNVDCQQLLPLHVDLLWVTVSMETVLHSIEGRITLWTVSVIRIHKQTLIYIFSQ